MIDTIQISKTFARPPNIAELLKNGWKPIRDKLTGEPAALCFNGAKSEPRLTLSKTYNDLWIVRAEVSFGSWLYGSNLYLLNESEFQHGLESLSEQVEVKSGIVFDAHTERVTRVDFTRDFQVGENAVIPIIAKFARLSLPKYKRVCYEDTSVYFKNSLEKGKLTKQFKIYSKHHERLANSKGAAEQERAKGVLRLEILHQKSAVNRLAKSLKLPNHHANYILTKETSEKVIEKAMKILNFESLLTAKNSNIESLFNICGSTEAYKFIGFLYMLDKYGKGFSKLPFVDTSQKTLKRYLSGCLKAGVLTLE